jgi:hypothetical protein
MTETDVGPRASDGWGHGASNQMNTQGFDDTCRVKHQLRKRRIRSSSMSAHATRKPTWSIRSLPYILTRRLCITCSNCAIRLFRDDAAGDTVPSVSCRVGLHIIRFGVNHQCRAAIAEQGVAVVAQGYILVYDLHVSSAFGVYREVVHVAGMVAFGILQAMLLSIRIEMRSRRLEVGRIALRLRMEVESVHSRWQVMESRLYDHSR